MSDFFHYKDGKLFAENCSVSDIAEQYGTPFYLYSAEAVKENYRSFAQALKSIPYECGIFYALKANSNQAIITLLAKCGAGADVVSKGEIMRAIKAGINPSKIVFSGVGKTQAEIAFALEHGILQFNVESQSELLLLNQIAQQKNITADIALRVNPDVDAKTHAKISTGKSENKFGIPIQNATDLYKEAQAMKHVNPVSIAVHIGSQLLDLQPYSQAWSKIYALAENLINNGVNIQRIDLGGGIGMNYNDYSTIALNQYANLVHKTFTKLKNVSFMFEPGRLLVGNSGILVTKIIHSKQGNNTRFIITDAAMNDLIRPTLYDGYHKIAPVIQNTNNKSTLSDVVGPVCESGDFLAKQRQLPHNLKNNDLLFVADVGAYGAVMSSTYNSRPLITEVLTQDSKYQTIRATENEDSIINKDSVPEWIK